MLEADSQLAVALTVHRHTFRRLVDDLCCPAARIRRDKRRLSGHASGNTHNYYQERA